MRLYNILKNIKKKLKEKHIFTFIFTINYLCFTVSLVEYQLSLSRQKAGRLVELEWRHNCVTGTDVSVTIGRTVSLFDLVVLPSRCQCYSPTAHLSLFAFKNFEFFFSLSLSLWPVEIWKIPHFKKRENAVII